MIKLNSLHKKRLLLFVCVTMVVTSVTALVLYGLKNSINLFVTPSALLADVKQYDQRVHLGGMVQVGSVKRDREDLHVMFSVTDFKRTVPVEYRGILPDLFREGKGVVMQGKLNKNGVFQAQEILAKHDENYVPQQMLKEKV